MLVLAVLVAVFEGASALLVPTAGDNLIADYYLNHTWRPNSEWEHNEWINANPDFSRPYRHHYNKQAWLEQYDVEKTKGPNVYRIFYLGDSFVEGTCPMDESVPSKVEARLNELARGMQLTFEVINTGTSSYSPTLYYLLARHRLMDYHPDLLVVNVDMTDCFDDWKYAQTLVVDAAGAPFAAPPRDVYGSGYLDTYEGTVDLTFRRRLQLFLLQHSHTYNLIASLRLNFRHTANSDQEGPGAAGSSDLRRDRWSWCREEWTGATDADVSRTMGHLTRLVDLCRKNGVKIVLTSVPHYEQYARRDDAPDKPVWSSRPHMEIAQLAGKLGVPYLNSFEALRPRIQGTPRNAFYYANDMHFNPRGYDIWARAHLDFLLEEEHALLPASFYRHVEGLMPAAAQKKGRSVNAAAP
jgi:hypothetical protein